MEDKICSLYHESDSNSILLSHTHLSEWILSSGHFLSSTVPRRSHNIYSSLWDFNKFACDKQNQNKRSYKNADD